MQDLTLSQCELMTIRYLCQLAEKLANCAGQGYVAPRRGLDVLNQIARLADRSEHIAQYALEDLGERTRAEYLERDLKAIELTLADYAQEMARHIGAVPNVEDVGRLREALTAVATA